MASAADDRPSSLFEGVGALLAPFPGRLEFAVRLALICALTTLVVEIYQTPEPALTVYVAFFVMKPDRAASVVASIVMLMLISLILGLVLALTVHATALGTSYTDNGSLNGTVSALSLQWLLFDFGERAAVVDPAKQGSVISNIAFTVAHRQLIYGVTLAFYNHAAARAHLTTATQSLKNAKDIQTAAEDRYQHGIGTVTEVAQARQGTAQPIWPWCRRPAGRRTLIWP
jgi:hypothetical protein